MAGKIRLAADLGATRRIRGRFSKGHQPARWRVARLAAAYPSENLTINPDVVQPTIRRVDVFVTLRPRVCRSLRSLLNSRLTTFNPRRARVVPFLSDSNNKYQPHLVVPTIFFHSFWSASFFQTTEDHEASHFLWHDARLCGVAADGPQPFLPKRNFPNSAQ